MHSALVQIKYRIKHGLDRVGLWYPIHFILRLPKIIRWLAGGCEGVAPAPIKLIIIRSYLKEFKIDAFIETGTYLGDTTGYLAKTGAMCTSIELSQNYFDAACQRFSNYKNVHLIHGDSGMELTKLMSGINGPTLFWLDGHYSAGKTACGLLETPIAAELKTILRHSIKRHVILIDDARCFDGEHDYPCLEDLLREIRLDGQYTASVSTDIIRLVPRT